MRSSVIKSDPGYRRHAYGTIITLDGVEVASVETADEELGEVVCLVREPSGGCKRKADKTGPERIIRRGAVVITPPAGQKKTRRRVFVRMFKPRFAPLVEAGSKCQTVRPTPKRIPCPGDIISLRTWTGKPYRSKQRVLRVAMVTDVSNLFIDQFAVSIFGMVCDRETFAQRDGFECFAEMRDWFEAEHGLPFTGIAIYWK